MPREGVKTEQRCFTDEEMGRLIAAAPEPFSTILAVISLLGLRIGEGLALRVGDIDFTNKIVRVRQCVDAATRTVQAVKSDASSADVPLPSQLEARLRTHLQKHEGKSDCCSSIAIGVHSQRISSGKSSFILYWRGWAFLGAGSIPCVTVRQALCLQTGQPRL
jgi:integrase